MKRRVDRQWPGLSQAPRPNRRWADEETALRQHRVERWEAETRGPDPDTCPARQTVRKVVFIGLGLLALIGSLILVIKVMR